MKHYACLLMLLMANGLPAQTADSPEPVPDLIFRSDVSLVRVDTQVVDRNNRAITGLRAGDFILREQGQAQEIRNFARESMPADVLFLLDVSGSMRLHVERLASASQQALRVLGEDDRVAIMVFDRATRVRMPFRASRQEVSRELATLLRQETFSGGTDITRALFDASNYVAREARRDARRAIVILTDDETERGRNEDGVTRALARSNTVLSALLAPGSMRNGPAGGGQWPNDPLGGVLGDIILGRRGGRLPGTIGGHSTLRSAGTAEIARRSGGDSMAVDDAMALETTLARIRQRYALYFNLPEGARPGQERTIEVALTTAALQRYPGAEVRYRRLYLTPGDTQETVPPPDPTPEVISQAPPGSDPHPGDDGLKRRPDSSESGGWHSARQPQATPASPSATSTEAEAEQGGWRRLPGVPEGGGWRRVGEPRTSQTTK